MSTATVPTPTDPPSRHLLIRRRLCSNMNSQGISSQLDSAIASFHEIIDGQIESVAELETWLNNRSASCKAYQEIISSLKHVLASNRARLLEARRAHFWPSSPGCASWGPVTYARTSSENLVVSGIGRETDERFEIRTSSDSDTASIEKFLGVVTSAVCCSSSDVGMLNISR
jgi:hypothetical protein